MSTRSRRRSPSCNIDELSMLMESLPSPSVSCNTSFYLPNLVSVSHFTRSAARRSIRPEASSPTNFLSGQPPQFSEVIQKRLLANISFDPALTPRARRALNRQGFGPAPRSSPGGNERLIQAWHTRSESDLPVASKQVKNDRLRLRVHSPLTKENVAAFQLPEDRPPSPTRSTISFISAEDGIEKNGMHIFTAGPLLVRRKLKSCIARRRQPGQIPVASEKSVYSFSTAPSIEEISAITPSASCNDSKDTSENEQAIHLPVGTVQSLVGLSCVVVNTDGNGFELRCPACHGNSIGWNSDTTSRLAHLKQHISAAHGDDYPIRGCSDAEVVALCCKRMIPASQVDKVKIDREVVSKDINDTEAYRWAIFVRKCKKNPKEKQWLGGILYNTRPKKSKGGDARLERAKKTEAGRMMTIKKYSEEKQKADKALTCQAQKTQNNGGPAKSLARSQPINRSGTTTSKKRKVKGKGVDLDDGNEEKIAMGRK